MGLLTGYGMSALVITYTENWWWAFYIVTIAMAPLLTILSFIDVSYIDVKEHLRLKKVANDAVVANENLSDMVSHLSSTLSPAVNLSRYE